MWLFFTFLAAFLWGVGQVFTKKGLSDTSPLFNNLLGALVILLIIIPVILIQGVNFNLILSILPLALIVALFFINFYYILAKGQVSLTGTVIATYPIITILLSVMFLNEVPSLFQKIAIVFVLFGTVLIALPEKVKDFKAGSWLWWAIIGSIFLGTGDFLAKIAINNSDKYTYIFTYSICFIFIAFLSMFLDKKGRQKIPKFNFKKYLPTLLGVTMMELGLPAFNIAISSGYVSLVSPISSSYTAITVILAWVFLKEKINKTQLLGIIFSVSGILLVGIA